jgi:hypothetical protein
MFYAFHSDQISKTDSNVGQFHYNMILPALKDFRGYVDVFAFDCQHPMLKNANEQVL